MQWLTASKWRVLAAGAVIAIAVGAVVVAVVATSGPGTQPSPAATATTTSTASTTPSTTPPSSALPTLAPLTTAAPATQPAPAATLPPGTAVTGSTTTVPPRPCAVAQVAVVATPDHAAYQTGQPVLLTLALVDTSPDPCTVSRKGAWAAFAISDRHSQTIWSAELPSGTAILLHPQRSTVAGSAVWAQYECASQPCGGSGPAAPPGTYRLVATVQLPAGTAMSAQVSFTTGETATTTTSSPSSTTSTTASRHP